MHITFSFTGVWMERNCAPVALLNVLHPSTWFIDGPDLDGNILDFWAAGYNESLGNLGRELKVFFMWEHMNHWVPEGGLSWTNSKVAPLMLTSWWSHLCIIPSLWMWTGPVTFFRPIGDGKSDGMWFPLLCYIILASVLLVNSFSVFLAVF